VRIAGERADGERVIERVAGVAAADVCAAHISPLFPLPLSNALCKVRYVQQR
jgi:hypothetical protein